MSFQKKPALCPEVAGIFAGFVFSKSAEREGERKETIGAWWLTSGDLLVVFDIFVVAGQAVVQGGAVVRGGGYGGFGKKMKK